MHVNNLGGVRMPVTANAGPSQAARTSFSTLVQGGAAASNPGRAALSGSNIIASAIAANSGGAPGFGAPYQQAMTASPEAGLSAERAAQIEQQKALKDLVKMSLLSFVSSTFAMGQNRPKPEEW